MELFLHPWYMIAGGVLVSSPILIHLINRMRFKRIRWAAMEFLLKSQKRNRRRLIIEQLLLLLLRILMVLLVAFLVARFVGGALAASGTGVLHAVVIDDTLSMSDRWAKEAGGTTNSFEVAKEQVAELAKSTSQASAAQFIKVMLLSEPDKVLLEEQISDRTVGNLDKALSDRKVTAMHVPAHVGLQKAQEEILGAPQGQKIVHLVSDFRETDWSSGPNTAELNKTVESLLQNKIHLSLIDTAHPFRKDTAGVARNHDNVCVESLKAGSRIIPEGQDIPFEVVVRNHGTTNVSPQLVIRVDGREENRGSTLLPSIAPGQEYTHKFDVRFNKKSKAPVEYIQIRAEIRPGDTGLDADHVRDLVLELREKIPVLVVDGRGTGEGSKPGGDLFYVQEGINATGSYVTVPVTLAELERLPLETYAAVYLLNVKTIPEPIVARLKAFVEKGGNLAFFLGPEIQASFYNEILHTQNNGLFPVMIELRPTDPLPPEERQRRLQNDPGNKILYRDKSHPIVREAFALNENLHLVVIDRYHELRPRSQWVPDAQKETVEVLTLPSKRTVEDFKKRVQPLMIQAVDTVNELAQTDKAMEKYKEPIEAYRRFVVTALEKEFLFELTLVLEDLLNNPGDPPPPEGASAEEQAKPRRPSMAELWARPQMRRLAQELKQAREAALFGDPLLVTRPYGKGKVVAFLSSAGPQEVEKDKQWNRLASGDPGSSTTFMPMMIELQLFLTSQLDTQNRLLANGAGGTLNFSFPKEEFGETLEVRFVPHPDFRNQAEGGLGQAAQEKPLATVKMTEGETAFTYSFSDTKRPGVYVFETTRKKAEAGAQKETKLFAFNVDAEAESNLKRAARQRLDENPTLREKYRDVGVSLLGPGESFDKFKTKDPDVSESPWLYLLFLIILICEQALAVHLSFHLKGNEGSGSASPAPRTAAA